MELPMTQSSIKVEFINTSEIHNRVFIAKPDHVLKKMDPNSDKIKQMNNIDRYALRPNILKQMCLADFISLTDTTYTAYKTQLSDDEQSIAESSSDDETCTTTETTQNNISHLFPIKLRNKIIKLRRHRKVIRFVNYKYKVDPENYCREKLLLYIPWQHDELKILEKHETYIDAYNYHQKDIRIKMKIFEPAAKTIENAMIEYEEHPEKFAPNSNSTIHSNNIIQPELEIMDTEYNFLIPEDEPNQNNYDLQEDLKIQKFNYIDSIQTKPNTLDQTELTNLINSLNSKQYEFYQYIIQKELQNENEQTLVCLHGGAGTGKSYTLKAIYQTLNQILNSKPGQTTTDLTTLLIAPTGKAAHNIKGHTIHAAFHIPANQSLANYTQLSWDNINSYRSKYLNLKWIICDEISMVSNYMLKFIHLRLQEIKCNNLLFGGINIITVGDLHQLKPVMGQFVFEDYKKDYGPLATNLWTENFKIYELTDIMRQKDDKQFAQLLNRLR
ncbi:MAG: AAA family ATPase, partial [Proteobacteria bacterium]|nr:AAA family ATPase [Pseudomonadota bacterium]